MEKIDKPKPIRWVTFMLIFCTMALCGVLFGGGIYSLYVSIGFKFLSNNTFAGINTTSLYTYSNSIYGTGTGRMVGLIIISIIMLGLGIGMAVIFFKQLPLFKQIKLIRNLPTVKYKEFKQQTRKGVIIVSIIAYIVCIAFSVFAIIVASRSGLAYNYVWAVIIWYFLVLLLSIVSMIIMIVKIVQLSKIKRQIIDYELDNKNEVDDCDAQNQKIVEEEDVKEPEIAIIQCDDSVKKDPINQDKITEIQIEKTDKLFSDGIFELGDQLQKLREMHISGLIDAEEYVLIREKWINAVLNEPLFGKKSNRVKKAKVTNKTNKNSVIDGASHDGLII